MLATAMLAGKKKQNHDKSKIDNIIHMNEPIDHIAHNPYNASKLHEREKKSLSITFKLLL